MANKEEMLSAGKIAKIHEITPKSVNEAIKNLGVEPDLVKSGCSYYAPATVDKILKAVK